MQAASQRIGSMCVSQWPVDNCLEPSNKWQRFVAGSCARGSEIVFDFAIPDDALGDAERIARAKRAERVAKIGEPWISYFDPALLVKELTAMGFSQAHHFGAKEANERYFSNRSDGFGFRGSARIMTARV